jgi:uncharacterized protein YsxB (DUF464 family)
MIKVNTYKKEDLYTKITFNGHALFADRGKDIVCSAVSSILTTTVNGIIRFDKGSLSYKMEKDGFVIENIKDDKTTQVLIENMVELLKELEEEYPTNIEVK